MRYLSSAIALALLAAVPPVVFGGIADLSVTNPQLVNEVRVSRTTFYVTYTADLVNAGAALPAVTATVTSLSPNIQTVPDQRTLHFSPVPANGTVTSSNTFTILVDRSVPFDWTSLQWSFSNPFANPGPDQTATIGSTVTLNGSGSTNPSGIGTLTYSWAFTSVPPGSSASLSNANTMVATFKVDAPGTYAIQLTVSNGVSSDSAVVHVSTINSPPVANAGSNQTVTPGSLVSLNGSGSSDVDGDPLTYLWSFVSIPSGSAAVILNGRSVSAAFLADVSGTYIVKLVVNDGHVDSQPSTVTISTGYTPPIANAGPNQTVGIGALVQLNGSGSTDVNGMPLTYRWSFNSIPNGSTASLSDTTAVNPTFTADVQGNYVAQLIVNDGHSDSLPSTVTISTNLLQAPTANAGTNQTVVHGATVNLSGSGFDPQGLPLTFKWSLLSLPQGSTAVLSATNIPSPHFVADQPGLYVAQLIVNNGSLSSAASTVTITTTNTPPVANAGPSQSVAPGAFVTLDGSQSSDADGDPLTYKWAFLSVPLGSNAALTGATTKSPTFTADLAGTYVVQLIVNDGFANSNPVTVTITAGILGITLSPSPLLLSNAPGTLTITLSPPAGANPVVVGLSGFDPGVVSLPPTVTVPANSSGVNVTATPVAVGTTQVIANAGGYSPGSDSVTVSTPSILLSFNGLTGVGLTHTITGTITLSEAAPQGGTTVTLSADPTAQGQVSFNPESVMISQGNTVGTFQLTGVALGSTTVSATAPGYNRSTQPILVVMLGALAVQSGVTVPPGQSTALDVELSGPAPADGVTVQLTSDDTSKVTVTPSFFIPSGATKPATLPQVTGVAIGSAKITATAGGYTSDNKSVSVVAGVSFSTQVVTVGTGGVQSINVLLSAPAPATGLMVNLFSSNPSSATVPASVSFDAGATSVPAQIKGVAAGSATITASTNSPFFSTTGASVNVTVTGPSLAVTTTSLPGGIINNAYSQVLGASGGTTPYTWSITAGSLPTGLILSGNTISGTPTSTGTFNFTVKVTDSTTPTAQTATQALSIVVSPALTITTASLANSVVNTSYSQTLAATNGTTPYTWSISAGLLPAGLTLSGNTISGTATSAGTFNFTVKVTDSTTPTAQTATKAFSIFVGTDLTITTTSLPNGVVNSPYSQLLAAANGTPPYTWSVSAGALPNGLTLSGNTISGTPTATGTFNALGYQSGPDKVTAIAPTPLALTDIAGRNK